MLEVKVENCAGIDVGKKFLAVCVLTGPRIGSRSGRFGDSARASSDCEQGWSKRNARRR